ncbi:MAG: N-acetylglutaminylglutamine amidotransferase, partial [Myxococcales bacterium]|nr:N-acetylglutaminylglutamine amidotransferase [Myxococcales bacterium]
MCGFSGEVTFDGDRASVTRVQRMTDALASRGPDGSGLFAQGRAALGHRRLKILDLSERAQQPMVDAARGLALVFNGCIYNFRELGDELRRRGHRLTSTGDTEVVLRAYAEWGPACVERLSGMFAFALYERESGRLVLARDRLGVKPLYLSRESGRLRFASSLPALLAGGDIDTGIDAVALHHYMTFHSVVPPPRTILRGVEKLPAATVAVIERDGARNEQQYWNLSFSRQRGDSSVTAAEWRARVHDSLRRAVERRMLADVPVGVLLSGGVDSSLVVGLLAEAGQTRLATFSIGFEAAHGERGDEFEYSDLVARAFSTEHHKLEIRSARLLEALPRAIAAMSEPMVSYDNVGFYLLAEEVSRHVKVVQSGQGADEIFAGYHWYPPLADSSAPADDYARVFFDRDHLEYADAVAPEHVAADHSRAFVAEQFAAPGAERAVDKALRLDTTVMLIDDPVKRVDNMT